MAINVSQAFKRTSIAPIDETLALTKAQMVATVDTLMPAYYFTICQDDGKVYLYDKSATPSVTTGKFTEFSGGGGGSSDVKFFTTTDTLSKEINGTKVVAAADLPGVTWSDLVVGSSVIKDAKGTMGLVTTITGTTSVTVTTATTSTPTVELTQAEYDALATKDPDTIYFITDGYTPSTYMGAYDTIYSTTERVVGSYMGKPLYQKTIITTVPTFTTGGSTPAIGTVDITDLEIDAVASIKGVTSGYASGLNYSGIVNIADAQAEEGKIIVFVRKNSSSGDIVIQNSISRYSDRTLTLTLQYTKTTDTTSPVEYATPNDYSTSEKIVGTWVDGKPIYQNTIQTTAPTPSGGSPGTSYISLGVSVDKLISYHGLLEANNGIDVPFGCFAYAEGLNVYVYKSTATDTQYRNTVRFMNGNSAWAGSNAYITVQYTKAS